MPDFVDPDPEHPDRPAWLEDDDEFEGVGAHRDNPRYDPVDEKVSTSRTEASRTWDEYEAGD